MHKNKLLTLFFTILISSSLAMANDVISGEIKYGLKTEYALAQNKFALSNIKPAHNDFARIIKNATSKDFILLEQAIDLAEYGFFDLTDEIFSKIDDFDISQNYIKEIKAFYYPNKRMDLEHLLQLAESYSNIMYNNYAQETIVNIINDAEIMQEQDYTFYILALGYYETKDFNQALNYISLATSQNSNINYKILKTKILLEVNQRKNAIKLLEEIKKTKLQIPSLKRKVDSLEQYVLYKTSKNENSKDYHLGYYYHLEGKQTFAQNVLSDGISNNPKLNGKIYSLLAFINLETNPKKAEEYAKKAIRTGFEDFRAPYTLATLKLKEEHLRGAQRLFTKAASIEKNSYLSKSQIADILKRNGKPKRAYKIWIAGSKKFPSDYNILYNLAQYNQESSENLLKKALSFNAHYAPAYNKLCEIYINRENFELAKKYANNLLYIDENDFKYYYYLSKIEALMGNNAEAEIFLKQCETIEPNYRDKIDKE